MKTLLKYSIVLISIYFNNVKAQNRITSNQTHLWVIYTGSFHLYKKLNLYTEYQFRRADLGVNWQQSLPRIGLEFKFNPQFQTTTGYGYITTYPYGEQPVAYTFNEHRIWEQFNLVHTIGKFKFAHRYRLEQRWLEKKVIDPNMNKYTFDSFNYLNRFRYRILISYPIWKKEDKQQELQIQLYDELFIGFGKNVSKNIFDQNRISFALSLSLNKHVSLMAGYLNQYVLKSNGIFAENNHTAQIGLNLTY